MFERFSNRARQTVVLAQEEARLLGHNYIGTEHILLGLLHQGDGVGPRALRRLGISLDGVRSDVESIIGRGREAPSGHIPFTPRAKKVLELSLREALHFGHNYIGTEHILLGLVREGDGVAAQVLVSRGADLERVRAVVVDEMNKAADQKGDRGAKRTSGVDDVMAAARALAGPAPMGSQHVLQALAESEDSLGGRVLAALGVDPDAIAAKTEELGTDGTTDVTPEETAARQLEVRLDGEEVHVVLRDPAAVFLARSITEPLGGPARGDDPATGSLVGVWQAVVGALEEVRRHVAPAPDGDAADDVGARRTIRSRRSGRRREE